MWFKAVFNMYKFTSGRSIYLLTPSRHNRSVHSLFNNGCVSYLRFSSLNFNTKVPNLRAPYTYCQHIVECNCCNVVFMLRYVMFCYVWYRSLENLRTGEEVALLLKMQHEAPEMFYKYANKILQIRDLSTIARLVWSLDDIVQKISLVP